MHSVIAARTCLKEHRDGKILADHFDERWEEYTCRLYAFPGTYHEFKDEVFSLGHEDNLSYQKVTSFKEFFRSVRAQFRDKYAARDSKGNLNPEEVWPEVPPEKYKNMRDFKAELKNWILARLPKGYQQPKKTAQQILKLATRTEPINQYIWNILIGNYASKNKNKTKKPIDGVSTLCHLEGLDDQSCIDLLANVHMGNITLDGMRAQAKIMKQKKRCFRHAMLIAKEQLQLRNVLCD